MEEKIRKCKYCGSEIKVKVGIHNWKNLFRKPSLEDWINLFIILMILVSAYAYISDINSMKEYYEGGDYCFRKTLEKNYNLSNPFTNLTYNNFSLRDNKSNLYLIEDINGSS